MPLTCEVVTPESTAISRTTEIVVVPLFDGELGILSRHAPMIGRLGAGELRLGHGDGAERYFIDGGFVQVRDDRVSILTQNLVPVSKLDAVKIQGEIDRLLSASEANPQQHAQLDNRIGRLRSRLRLAERQG